MKLHYYSTLILLLTLTFGCSSTSDTPKSDEKLHMPISPSKDISSNNITITIPSNWTEIKDNSNPIFEIWLINSAANAVISFIPIHISSELNLNEASSELNIIEEFLISKKKNSGKEFSIVQEELLSSNYSMKSIQYLIDDTYQNSIIFGENKTFYECLAYFQKEYQPSSEEIKVLFETQKLIAVEAILK